MRLVGVLMMVFVCLTSPAFGSIVGETMNVDWRYPDIGTSIFSQNVVIAGSVFPGMGVGEVNVQDGQITIENQTYGWSGTSGFNGFIFTDVFGTIPAFTSLSLVSISGFPPPVDPILSFTDDQLFINFNADAASNIGEGIGQLYTFSYTYVPLPGSVVLLLTGMAALTGLRLRLKK